jgi:DMSO/TMAO reductase YedYZ molybdopterin-dependent catalytic subunit
MVSPVKISIGAILAIFLMGCAKPTAPVSSVKIRNYEGENLSSVTDFRENSIKGPQHIDVQNYQLKILGLVDNPVSYSYQQVIDGFPHSKRVVTLDCVEGWSVKILWEGMSVKDLVNAAKPSAKANTVIFHAADGYTTSFPLSYLIDNDILMAYQINGSPLAPETGFPFQLVAQSKWGYKWIKWITEIELSDNPGYKGYWEQRGYSNSGDLDKSFEEP